MNSGSWNKEFVLYCCVLSLWFWQTLPPHLFWRKKKQRKRKKKKRKKVKTSYCWSGGNMGLKETSRIRKVLFFSREERAWVCSHHTQNESKFFNSFSLSYLSGNQKNHLQMIRPDQLSSVKSRRILQHLHCLIIIKHSEINMYPLLVC